MNKKLRKKFENIEPPPIKIKIGINRYLLNLSLINIAIISAIEYHRNL
jgi:hypothetical protein